jgi:hypothetical protein
MNYEQEILDSRLSGDLANCMPSLPSCFIDTIEFNQAVLILKYKCRQFERDSAMFALVLPVLPFAHS